MNPRHPRAPSVLAALMRWSSPFGIFGTRAVLLAFAGDPAVAGCAGTPPEDSAVPSSGEVPVDVSDYFALTAGRTSRFSNGHPTVTWHLTLEVDAVTVVADDREIVTVHYSKEEDSGVVGSVQWSSDADGTWIHGFSDGEGDAQMFDPPVAVTSPGGVMAPGDVVDTLTTTSDGVEHAYSSTFVVATIVCPFMSADDMLPCVQFDIDVASDSQIDQPLFVGSAEYVAGYGPIWMTNPVGEGDWLVNEISFPER